MVFSAPRSAEQAEKLMNEPRYVQQWLRRNWTWRHPKRLPLEEIHADWSQSMGTGATVGAGQYPAKYVFQGNYASCSDYIVFNTSLAGSSTQASVIAYTNLYTGCPTTGTTVPAVYWAYNTGGTVTTSVTLSPDGSQIAFVQAQGGVATLVILKWKSSTTESASAPLTLTSTAASSYRNCTAPCMTTFTFAAGSGETGTIKDTYSSPYYDFSYVSGAYSDRLFVGDDLGYAHQFTGVFLGTPAESTSPWPVRTATAPLSSPVYDSMTGNVFMTTSFQISNDSGGRMHSLCATSTCAGINNGNGTVAIGTVTPSGILGPSAATGSTQICHGTGASGDTTNLRVDAPIIDSTAGRLYFFIGNDGNGNSAIIQFPTLTSSTSYHACGTEVTVGTGSTTGVPMFAGNFDNLYLTSSTGSTPSGNIYVCGNAGGNATLYQIGITSNAVPASGTTVLALTTANTTCSQVTESYASPTDRIFLSVQSNANTSSPISCPTPSGGCVMSFSVPTTTGGALPTSTSATLAASGGTSGIVVDNTVAPGTMHTSQVYFSTLTGGTAVQASQAALQ